MLSSTEQLQLHRIETYIPFVFTNSEELYMNCCNPSYGRVMHAAMFVYPCHLRCHCSLVVGVVNNVVVIVIEFFLICYLYTILILFSFLSDEKYKLRGSRDRYCVDNTFHCI